MRVFHRSGIKGTNRTQPCWPQVDRYQQRKCRSSTLTARVWCVQRCATKGSNRSSRQHLRWKLCESYSVLRVRKTEDPFLISIADVSRAPFYADAVRDVYVRLPDEDPKAKQPGVCGKLRKTMYGSLDAAQRWGEHNAQVLKTGGFFRGVASPCHFSHKDLETYILVHGDDFFL